MPWVWAITRASSTTSDPLSPGGHQHPGAGGTDGGQALVQPGAGVEHDLGNINRIALNWRGLDLVAEIHRGLSPGTAALEPGARVSLGVAPQAGVWVRV